jgi:hypothetical protein
MTPWKAPDGSEWETRGEAMVRRELRTEKRSGVDHYVVGQYHAEEVEPDDPREAEEVRAALLSYVTHLGVVCVPMVREEGAEEWTPIARAFRVAGLGVDYGPRPLPDDWELNDEMKAALARLDP